MLTQPNSVGLTYLQVWVGMGGGLRALKPIIDENGTDEDTDIDVEDGVIRM